MKTIMKLSFMLLTLLSFSSYADGNKYVITGEPVVLEQQGDVYTLPATYTETSSGYYYVKMKDNKEHVCFLQSAAAPAALTSLTPVPVTVMVGGNQVVWNCYDYNPEYFTVNTTTVTH